MYLCEAKSSQARTIGHRRQRGMGVPVVEPRVLRRQIFSKYTPVCCVWYAAVYAYGAYIGEKNKKRARGVGVRVCLSLSGVVSEQGIL